MTRDRALVLRCPLHPAGAPACETWESYGPWRRGDNFRSVRRLTTAAILTLELEPKWLRTYMMENKKCLKPPTSYCCFIWKKWMSLGETKFGKHVDGCWIDAGWIPIRAPKTGSYKNPKRNETTRPTRHPKSQHCASKLLNPTFLCYLYAIDYVLRCCFSKLLWAHLP